MTTFHQLPVAVTPASDAARARFPVRSQDPAFRTQLTTDFALDATTAAGFQAGSIPADTANIGTLVNIANNSPPAIPSGIRGAVTALINSGAVTMANSGSAGGIGFVRNGEATSNGVKVVKAGLGANVVGHPPTEGFLDFLVTAWIKPTALNYWSLFGCSNNNSGANQYKFWGAECTAGGSFRESLSLRVFTGVLANVWSQIGTHYRYASGNIYVRTFVNGAEVNAASAGTALAVTQAAQTAATLNNARLMLGSNYIDPCFKGMIGRCDRFFTGIAGNTLDPLLLIQQGYAANHLRITGA